jgi:hypothetical protein
VTGATEPLPGGGKRTRLAETGEDGTAVVLSYDFDAKGRIVRYERSTGGRAGPPYIITRNDRGDVGAYRMGEQGAPTEYEYQYDDRGNWTRRETFRTERGARTSTEVEFRRITYGPGPAVAQARPASQPAAIDARALAGTYQSEMGKKGEGFHSVTRFELKPDGTLHYVQTDTFRGTTTEKEASGTWSLRAGTITLRLEKSIKGPPLPPSGMSLPTTRGTDGKSLVGPDGKRVFQRVG